MERRCIPLHHMPLNHKLLAFSIRSMLAVDCVAPQVVRAHYPPERVAFIYGEDLPYPLHLGWPMEGVQRVQGSRPTLPSLAQVTRRQEWMADSSHSQRSSAGASSGHPIVICLHSGTHAPLPRRLVAV